MHVPCCNTNTVGTELLVWYGEEYAKDLGIEVTSAHLDYCSDSDDSSDNEDKPSKLHSVHAISSVYSVLCNLNTPCSTSHPLSTL